MKPREDPLTNANAANELKRDLRRDSVREWEAHRIRWIALKVYLTCPTAFGCRKGTRYDELLFLSTTPIAYVYSQELYLAPFPKRPMFLPYDSPILPTVHSG